MPCSTQAVQQLTTTALTSICGVPVTQSNFFTPLSTDLNNIKDQSFMDDGSSCSRLIAPDKTDLFTGVIANITNTNISSINIGAVPYPSRLLITGTITDTMDIGAGTHDTTAVVNISTGNYAGGIGAVIFNKKRFYKAAGDSTIQVDDKDVSYLLDVASNVNPTIYFSTIATIANKHSLDLDIQVIRIHQ